MDLQQGEGFAVNVKRKRLLPEIMSLRMVCFTTSRLRKIYIHLLFMRYDIPSLEYEFLVFHFIELNAYLY